MEKLNERLMELEIRYTHQAQLIEELNEVLTFLLFVTLSSGR